MRTKALLLMSLLGVAAVANLQAQTVFSVNAVGYVNVEVPAGFSIIANPLDAASNTVNDLFASAPNSTALFKFVDGAFQTNTKVFGNFTDQAQTLEPGEAAFIFNPGDDAMTITFVGEVRQGNLTTAISEGFTLVSSQVPQSGGVSSVLGLDNAGAGDSIHLFRDGSYASSTFVFGSWQPSEPTPGVGEGFFYETQNAIDWVRDFSIN